MRHRACVSSSHPSLLLPLTLPELPFELRVGLRYTRAGRRAQRRNTFISFTSAISVAGIAIGVWALIVVLSVMNGFTKDVRDRMLSVVAHVEIGPLSGAMPDWQQVAAIAKNPKEVPATAPVIHGQAMLV